MPPGTRLGERVTHWRKDTDLQAQVGGTEM